VEAATKKKFDDGMAVRARDLHQPDVDPECRSLRHLFLAERAASKIPDVPEDTPKRDINSVGSLARAPWVAALP
jgi:3-hydroxyacyl-CoA dehydrogenase